MNIVFAVILFVVGTICVANAFVHGILDPWQRGLNVNISGPLIVLSMAAAAFAGGYVLVT